MHDSTVEWLLDGDAAIGWQTLRDVVGAPEAEVAALRRRVAGEGWSARLLSLQRDDGTWAGGACFPKLDAWPEHQPWTATMWVLRQLRDNGVDPTDPAVAEAAQRVADGVRWEHDGQHYFDGEVEPCINGQTLAVGSYLGQPVGAIAARLLGEVMADGGWNCEQENGSVRSSFDSTMGVLEGLLDFERCAEAATDPALLAGVGEARASGEEYLLARHLMRRLSTGEVPVAGYLDLVYPPRWHYDVLRALDHFRAADHRDPRLADAVGLVRSQQRDDGRWSLDRTHPGEVPFVLEDDGAPSRWVTLRALRVLRWWDAG